MKTNDNNQTTKLQGLSEHLDNYCVDCGEEELIAKIIEDDYKMENEKAYDWNPAQINTNKESLYKDIDFPSYKEDTIEIPAKTKIQLIDRIDIRVDISDDFRQDKGGKIRRRYSETIDRYIGEKGTVINSLYLMKYPQLTSGPWYRFLEYRNIAFHANAKITFNGKRGVDPSEYEFRDFGITTSALTEVAYYDLKEDKYGLMIEDRRGKYLEIATQNSVYILKILK